jgi:uracil-DNA glycosylase
MNERKGFFKQSALIKKAPLPLIPSCGLCGLYRNCSFPKIGVRGDGDRGILVVGDHPVEDDLFGNYEDSIKNFFSNEGINLYKDCWVTDALICDPQEKVNNKWVEYCRPNIINTIKKLNPIIIITLGEIATKSVVGADLKTNSIGLWSRWPGWAIPSQNFNAWVCPTYHPKEWKEDDVVCQMFFRKHLRQALSKTNRPHAVVPNYFKQCEIDLTGDRVIPFIKEWTNVDKFVAFDLETNKVKPDSQGSKIICCSISDGERSFAYPWYGKMVEATKEFLVSSTPKVSSNMKFEDRWIQSIGIMVRNWAFDTMLTAHVLDNRKGITGLKFQSYVMLGQSTYNDQIEPFLKSDSPNEPNKIKEIDLSTFKSLQNSPIYQVISIKYTVTPNNSSLPGWFDLNDINIADKKMSGIKTFLQEETL